MNNIQTSVKERIDYLDVAKGIGIFLVVWEHINGPFYLYIRQFHMPLFFMISGYLYHDYHTVKTFIMRKVRSLYVPFVVWNFIAFSFSDLIGYKKYPLKKYIEVFLTLDKNGVFFGATWFLGALFVISVLYRLMDEILKSCKYRHVILLVLFTGSGILGYKITLPYKMSRTLIMSMFFAFAVCFKDNVNKFSISRSGEIFSVLVSTGIFSVLSCHNFVNLAGNTYGNFYAFLIEALAASYVTIKFSSFINNHLTMLNRLLKWLGTNSIYIVLWQFVMFKLVIAVQMILAGEDLKNILDYHSVYSTEGLWLFAYVFVGLFFSVWIGRVLTIQFWKDLIIKIIERYKLRQSI